jgi:glucan phosphoethanolaminetransferase (alkaline phosphatase superfamily)
MKHWLHNCRKITTATITVVGSVIIIIIFIMPFLLGIITQVIISAPLFPSPHNSFIILVLFVTYEYTSAFSFLAYSKYLSQTSDTLKPKYAPVQRIDSALASLR